MTHIANAASCDGLSDVERWRFSPATSEAPPLPGEAELAAKLQALTRTTALDFTAPAGRFIAAVVNGREGQELWTIAADGSAAQAVRVPHRIAFPAWTPRGAIACIAIEIKALPRTAATK